jgi:hypothetical protein
MASLADLNFKEAKHGQSAVATITGSIDDATKLAAELQGMGIDSASAGYVGEGVAGITVAERDFALLSGQDIKFQAYTAPEQAAAGDRSATFLKEAELPPEQRKKGAAVEW